MTKDSPLLCPFCSQVEDKYIVHAHSIPEMNILIAEKYIPIEKIDALIQHYEGHGISIEYNDTDIIKILEGLKK